MESGLINRDENIDPLSRWKNVMDVVNTANREIQLCSYYSNKIDHDIKQLNFALNRYKFASKMMEYNKEFNLLELGCNNGLGTRFFRQIPACNKIVGIDFDAEAIKWANHNFKNESTVFIEDDFLNKNYTDILCGEKFDAVISIDVLEHIESNKENLFLETIEKNLKDTGVAIIGTPNITMAPYASEESKIGHVNLFDQKRLYRLLNRMFNQVFIFGMNDEIVHTGYAPMSCYIIALCCHKK